MSDHQDERNATLDPETRPTPSKSTERVADQNGGPHPASESTRVTDWYCLAEGRIIGPCALEQLLSDLRAGELPPDCRIWSSGMKEWTPLEPEAERGKAFETNGRDDTPPEVRLEPAEANGKEATASPIESEPPEPFWTAKSAVNEGPSGNGSLSDSLARVDDAIGSGATLRFEVEPGRTKGSFVPAFAMMGWGARPNLPELAATPAYTDYAGTGSDHLIQSPPPRPWKRWFARIVDTTLAALGLGIGLAVFAPESGFFESSIRATLFVLATWLVIESIVLALFGTTPGKALMNVELTRANGERLSFRQAFERSARVWAFGMAGGLPIVGLVAMAMAYRKLRSDGRTSWDRAGDFVVRHGRLGLKRYIGITAFAMLYIVLMVLSIFST